MYIYKALINPSYMIVGHTSLRSNSARRRDKYAKDPLEGLAIFATGLCRGPADGHGRLAVVGRLTVKDARLSS